MCHFQISSSIHECWKLFGFQIMQANWQPIPEVPNKMWLLGPKCLCWLLTDQNGKLMAHWLNNMVIPVVKNSVRCTKLEFFSFCIRDHPFKTSACLRGEGYPHVPMVQRLQYIRIKNLRHKHFAGMPMLGGRGQKSRKFAEVLNEWSLSVTAYKKYLSVSLGLR